MGILSVEARSGAGAEDGCWLRCLNAARGRNGSGGAWLGAHLWKRVLGWVRALFRIVQLVLDLAVLLEVQVGNLETSRFCRESSRWFFKFQKSVFLWLNRLNFLWNSLIEFSLKSVLKSKVVPVSSCNNSRSMSLFALVSKTKLLLSYMLLYSSICYKKTNFFGLFDLSLLGLQFVLKFVDQVLEAFKVLLVFINLKTANGVCGIFLTCCEIKIIFVLCYSNK